MMQVGTCGWGLTGRTDKPLADPVFLLCLLPGTATNLGDGWGGEDRRGGLIRLSQHRPPQIGKNMRASCDAARRQSPTTSGADCVLARWKVRFKRCTTEHMIERKAAPFIPCPGAPVSSNDGVTRDVQPSMSVPPTRDPMTKRRRFRRKDVSARQHSRGDASGKRPKQAVWPGTNVGPPLAS